MAHDDGPSVAELLAALDENGGVQGDDKWKRLGIDFDTWNWYSSRTNAAAKRCPLDDSGAFTWARDVKDIENELLSEGVALMGHVSEAWLAAVEDFCESCPFDNVLTLGCERREDGYADKGPVIGGPWKEWMAGLNHSYDYASVITAFPTDDYDQGWHRDTPDDKESTTTHQVTLMVYFTHVEKHNGATEFRRIVSKDVISLPGPRGSVVAFLSSRTQHRGLANRSDDPRVLMYIAFECDEGQDPASFIR